MSIRALKVRPGLLILGRDIPASAALVGDKRTRGVGFCDTSYEGGVSTNAGEAVVNAQGGALEGAEQLGHGGLLVLREDEV
jgi:hypothetical protein